MSSPRSLLLQVFWADGRYHGAGNWPPEPARVFQALVAGAGPRQDLPNDAQEALRWLESLPAPIIHAPWARRGQKVQMFVPHNDLDTKGGDPNQVSEIRVGKVVQPWLFDARVPISYLWTFNSDPESEKQATRIQEIAQGLYQLGRGVDMASAQTKILSTPEAFDSIRTAPGEMLRPSVRGLQGAIFEQTCLLDTPVPGTFASLTARYAATAQRFGVDKSQKKAVPTFTQPPAAEFVSVAYGSGRARVLFDLRNPLEDGKFVPWRQQFTAALVRRIRDLAIERLVAALPKERKTDIENALLGRVVDGRTIPAEHRVRIIPLPSIGHEHVDRSIRRILLDIPAECPVNLEDICWAFSGLSVIGAETGEEFALLVAAENTDMLEHYGFDNQSLRRWRTVTPMVLGEQYGLRGPIPEKLETAIADALRHEGVGARPVIVHAQRMPFEKNGMEAARFADQESHRFSELRLWHVDVTLDRPIRGPLLLGDGRYFGLGLLAPLPEKDGLLCYRIEAGLTGQPSSEQIAQALRRAVMARMGKEGELDAYVHGHEGAGALKNQPHLYYQYDPVDQRLWIMAPHVVERHELKRHHLWNKLLVSMRDFSRLLAGTAGALDVKRQDVDWDSDPLLAPARQWESISPYVANRHYKAADAHSALAEDVQQSLQRGHWPTAQIEVLQCFTGSEGLAGRIRLSFASAVSGPIVLGRRRFVGGGLFRAVAR